MHVHAMRVQFCNGPCWVLFDESHTVIGIRGGNLDLVRDDWERQVGPLMHVQILGRKVTIAEAAAWMERRKSGIPLLPLDRKQRAAGERDEGGAKA